MLHQIGFQFVIPYKGVIKTVFRRIIKLDLITAGDLVVFAVKPGRKSFHLLSLMAGEAKLLADLEGGHAVKSGQRQVVVHSKCSAPV